MSAKHRELLHLAAEKMGTLNDDDGMCWALFLAFRQVRDYECDYSAYHGCKYFLARLYRDDSPYRCRLFWMGTDSTKEQHDHRVMALLFAAECFDDMEGV